MEGPDEPLELALRRAVDGLVADVAPGELRRAAERLAAAYRGGGDGARRAFASRADRLAYLAARLPATFEAARAVLAEVRRRAPALRAESLLELGAGPAPGLWAAPPAFPELVRATCVEIDPGMAELGRSLCAAGPAAGVAATWRAWDVARAREAGPHDLVLLAYVLGELPASDRERAMDAAWDAAAGALVIVEPGTPDGAARVLAARARLIERGAAVAAPCPHAGPCPLPDGDWCHFAARVSRSRLLRRLKAGRLPYEDEKYAWAALTREAAEPCAARVLRRPVAEPRRVRLRLCTAADGVREELVTRREGPRYRAARKMRWGAAWPPAAAPEPDAG